MKLIILDRDGVINEDSDDYIKSPMEWVPLPGSLAAIAALKSAGWKVAVATNQSGLRRNLFDFKTLAKIHRKMRKALLKYQAEIDYLVYCPHGPNDGCSCRKPKTGMYLQIATHFKCSLINVPVIGDSQRDLDAAVSVGAQPILVTTGKGQKTFLAGRFPAETIIHYDLQAAVDALLSSA